jgi:cytochrome c oxidase subunit II
MPNLFLPSASANAPSTDLLLACLAAVSIAVLILVFWLLLSYVVRYRASSPVARGDVANKTFGFEMSWTAATLVVFFGLFLWGAFLYVRLFQSPTNVMRIYVVAKQWMWKAQHPGGQREINELHIPVDRPVKLTLTSEDVIHDFFVPAFRTKIDVIPGRYVHTWFHPTKTGRFHLFCSQYCGTSHANMVGSVVVMERAEYADWLDSHAEGSLALQGRKLFLKLQCITCHSANSQARAPVLEDLYGRTVNLRDGRTVVADNGYLRESILYPEAKVVQGWESIMPTFKGQVNEEELIRLLAFIKSLKRWRTPVRTEDFPPPLGAPETPPGGNPRPPQALPTARPEGKSNQP